MNRREYVVLGGGIVLTGSAGCVDEAVTEAQSLVSGEEYETGTKEELLPDSVQPEWPDQDLGRHGEDNDTWDRIWANEDADLAVMMSIKIWESVEDAKDSMDRQRSTGGDTNEYPLADDAFWYEDTDNARAFFRDSNAVGQIVAARQTGFELQPDRQRATTYAEHLHNYWMG